MVHTDLKFFTNEPERDLYSRFAAILKSNTQFFDVLVGYFRASGFFKMYEALEQVEKIRILVGLNVDNYTVKIMSEKAKGIHADMKKASARMKVITGIQNAVADCQTHKAVHDKYLKIGWKTRQAAFAESHKDELDSFNKAFRYLKKQGVDLNVNLDSLQAEYDKLKATHRWEVSLPIY